MKLVLKTNSANLTAGIAKDIGSRLKGGEIIVLSSDLGGGKTTFTQGLALGLGITEIVTSPTFAVSDVYKGLKLELHHYDFYRLGSEIGIMKQELEEVMDNKDTVCVIEWADFVKGSLPESRTINVTLDRQKEGEDVRLITIENPDNLQYAIDAELLEDIKC
ncbi:MAG: tRNA (adenosine(37)-N6)-threonylcarbamoyltransferase complex ATPase subunit type 1 TsaE [Candidatus Saccharibacteria bacterium]|nr:tRNA (adenosine(37)-N6)-threonylcarbamoyltransferase complex ATPase subunit type 1 TsaE [Candidatus Saccharibacteria bacterium]